jgi:hypothetical protein
MVGIPQPAAYKPIVRSNNGDLPAYYSMLKFAPFMTLLQLCGLSLGVRSVSPNELTRKSLSDCED